MNYNYQPQQNQFVGTQQNQYNTISGLNNLPQNPIQNAQTIPSGYQQNNNFYQNSGPNNNNNMTSTPQQMQAMNNYHHHHQQQMQNMNFNPQNGFQQNQQTNTIQ